MSQSGRINSKAYPWTVLTLASQAGALLGCDSVDLRLNLAKMAGAQVVDS